jgi:hypothetical protein
MHNGNINITGNSLNITRDNTTNKGVESEIHNDTTSTNDTRIGLNITQSNLTINGVEGLFQQTNGESLLLFETV